MTRSLVALVNQFFTAGLHPSPGQTSLNGSYPVMGSEVGSGPGSVMRSAAGSSTAFTSAFAFLDLDLDDATGGGGEGGSSCNTGAAALDSGVAFCMRLCISG